MNKPTKKEMLNAKEAAEHLGICVRYLHNLRSNGLIPFHRIGVRKIVFQRIDLDNFLKSCRVGETAVSNH